LRKRRLVRFSSPTSTNGPPASHSHSQTL
jgi:hypothetical protein